MNSYLIRGQSRLLPVRERTVDLVLFSPPYFGLRDYRDDGSSLPGQIGQEPSLDGYLTSLLDLTAQCVDVLTDDGNLFVNLGDRYVGGGMGGNTSLPNAGPAQAVRGDGWNRVTRDVGYQDKTLLGVPWRFANAAVDQLGLVLRTEIIWCLSGESCVYARTESGDRPIKVRDLPRQFQPHQVQLWNGERWTNVLGWRRSERTDRPLELELRSGERIGCTPEHQWPTARGLLRADQLQVGDELLTTSLPEPDAPTCPSNLPDLDAGWLVGLYLAEGSRGQGSNRDLFQFSGHTTQHDHRDYYTPLARIAASFDAPSRWCLHEDGNGADFKVSGPVVAGIIERYVSEGTDRTKRLTMHAWQRSNEFLTAVMDGYLSGTGSYEDTNDRWLFRSAEDDGLVSDLRTMAARVGASLTLRRSGEPDPSFGDSDGVHPGWRGEWRWNKTGHRDDKPRSEIVAIRRSHARYLYDISVEDEPHLFALASGVLTHNCRPNAQPESVKDRCRRNHEYLFHFSKRPTHYSAASEAGDNDGRPPLAIWEINTDPFRAPDHLGVDHHAPFPVELARRVIEGWSPRDVCLTCGTGRRPVWGTMCDRCGEFRPSQTKMCPGCGFVRDWKQGRELNEDLTATDWSTAGHGTPRPPGGFESRSVPGGWECDCWQERSGEPPPPTRPGVVLDPCVGSGTTVLTASVLGRTGIGVDLSWDYLRLANWRIRDPRQRAKVQQRRSAANQLTLL